MKLSSALALLFLPARPSGAALSSANQGVRRRLLTVPQEDPCLLVKRNTEGGNTPSTEEWTCELSSKDAERAGRKFVEVQGLTVKDLQQIKSGVTTLLAIGGSLENGMLMVPPGALRKFGIVQPRGPAAAKKRSSTTESMKTGSIVTASVEGQQRAGAEQRTVLAVRVVASDGAPTASLDELSDSIFGTFGDPVNLRERFASCSYGQTLMEPFSGVTSTGASISNGVVEININAPARGSPDADIVDATWAALAASIGSVETEFDHVMLCLPPGTISSGSDGWVAYAGVGSYYSIYNNDACTIAQVQVHEIGHNLGLNHANEADEEYGDDTGNMGNGNFDDDAKLCYNPAKSWQLGWYQDRRQSLDFSSQGSFSGQLVGVDDYQDANANGKYVNLQIVVPESQQAYYVGFNLATGINAETAESQNLVTIQSQDGESVSYLQASFGAGQSGTISNFINGETLTISVPSIDMNASPPVANVEIYLGDGGNQPPPPSSGSGGDWELCSCSDQCTNGCCSSVYSNDGQLKCTPLDGGFRPDLCVGANGGGGGTSPSLHGDWELCSASNQCTNGCCSSEYSNDGQFKCTPLDGGFRPDLCMA